MSSEAPESVYLMTSVSALVSQAAALLLEEGDGASECEESFWSPSSKTSVWTSSSHSQLLKQLLPETSAGSELSYLVSHQLPGYLGCSHQPQALSFSSSSGSDVLSAGVLESDATPPAVAQEAPCPRPLPDARTQCVHTKVQHWLHRHHNVQSTASQERFLRCPVHNMIPVSKDPLVSASSTRDSQHALSTGNASQPCHERRALIARKLQHFRESRDEAEVLAFL